MKKFLLYSLLAVGIFSFVGANIASAHGWFGGGINLDPETIAERQNQMFENKAELLGISVDQMKEYWSEGKSIQEIIEELGIDKEELQETMRQARLERMQEHLQILVDNGVITQDQADQRLQIMQERFENGGLGKGFHGGRGRGFGFRGAFGW